MATELITAHPNNQNIKQNMQSLDVELGTVNCKGLGKKLALIMEIEIVVLGWRGE